MDSTATFSKILTPNEKKIISLLLCRRHGGGGLHTGIEVMRSRGLHQCYDRVTVLCFLARHSIASVYFFKPPAEQDAQKQILKMKNLGLFHLFLSAYLFP